VVLTAREAADLQARATAAGASARLVKPFAYAELLAVLERLRPSTGA
jgi:AmiR/NasT family two-component response regulator